MMRAHTAPASLGLCWHRWVRGSGLALGLCGCGSSQGSGGITDVLILNGGHFQTQAWPFPGGQRLPR